MLETVFKLSWKRSPLMMTKRRRLITGGKWSCIPRMEFSTRMTNSIFSFSYCKSFQRLVALTLSKFLISGILVISAYQIMFYHMQQIDPELPGNYLHYKCY